MNGGNLIPSALHRLCWYIAGVVGYRFTVARLWLFDRLAGPFPETPTDRTIREKGERLRKAFPQIDFNSPKPRIISPPREGDAG